MAVEQEDKLFAAPAEERLAFLEVRADSVSKAAQDLVSHLVTVGVIELFEMVDVEHVERERVLSDRSDR